MVSEIHRNMSKSQDGADDQRGSVSDICIPLHYRINKRLLSRLKPGLLSLLRIDPASYANI